MGDFFTIDEVGSRLGLDLYDEDIKACGIQSSGVPGRYPQGRLVYIAERVRAKCAISDQGPAHGSLGVVLSHYLDTCRAEGVSVSEELILRLLDEQRCVKVHGSMRVYHYWPMVIEPPRVDL